MASDGAIVPRKPGLVRWRPSLSSFAILAACSFALAWLALLPPQTRRLDVGRPGDAVWLDGMSEPAYHRGAAGRWTNGDARVRLGAPGLPVRVRLRVGTAVPAGPARLELELDGSLAARAQLDREWTEVALTSGDGSHAMLTLRSAVTASPEGERRGVFLDWVEVTGGGTPRPPIAAHARLALVMLACLVIALLVRPLVVAARVSASRGWVMSLSEWWLPVAAGAGALIVSTLLRDQVLEHVGTVTAAAWGLAACTGTVIRAGDDAPRRGWIAPVTFGIVSILLVAGLFSDAWLRGRVLSQADILYDHTPWLEHRPADWRPLPRAPFGDVPMFVYPFHTVFVERMRRFELPLWTPGVGAGVPVLANYQSALLSPFTWLLLIVPLPAGTVVLAVCRLLVGGAGMFWFLRRIGLSAWPSGIGGIAYLLSPVTIVWLEHPLANVSPWLPWMLLAADRAVAGGLAALGGLAFVTALTLVGGHPHLALYVTGLGTAYAVAAAMAQPRPVPRMARALCAIGVGAGMAALQILPFLEYATQSRTIEMRNAHVLNPFVAPVQVFMTALVPDAFGHPGYANYAGPLNYLEQLNYAGVSVLLLAAIGLAAPGRTWRPWFFASVVAAGCLAIYGTPGLHHLISALPLVRSASLVRLAFVVAGAAAILAAFGVEALARPLDGPARSRLATVTCAAALAVCLAVLAFNVSQHSFLARHALTAFVSQASVGSAIIVAATTAAILLRLRQGLPFRIAALALAAIVATELSLFARDFHPLVEPALVFPTTPELARLQEDTGLHRVVAAGGGLLPNTALVYGLQDLRSYDGLGVKQYGELLDAAAYWGDSFHAVLRFDSPLFDLLNVRYVLGPAGMMLPPDRFTRIEGLSASLYRNERALPRAFVVDRYRVATGNAARRLLRDGGVDYRREVLLETEPGMGDRPDAASAAATPGDARVLGYRNERVDIETETAGRRLLVLTDAWFPGWTATIDGRNVPILRADVAFRAVSVPAGRHLVAFEYRPASVRTGAWISAFALATAVLTTLVGLVRRRIT
jgi:hypothetical protein